MCSLKIWPLARFTLNRSQRAKLAYEIGRFNKTMEGLGIPDPLSLNYKKIAPYIGNSREFNQLVKRLQRLQKSRNQRVYTNENGVQYTAWEKTELKRLTKKSNRNRLKILEQIHSEYEAGYHTREDIEFYRPREYNIDTVLKSRGLHRIIWFELREGLSRNMKERDSRYVRNLIESLNSFPKSETREKLKRLLENTDQRKVTIISLDDRYGLSIRGNYEALLGATYGDISETEAIERLFDKWEYAIGVFEKYGRTGL